MWRGCCNKQYGDRTCKGKTYFRIHAALWDYAEKHGIKIEGLQKPKNDISEGEEAEEEEY